MSAFRRSLSVLPAVGTEVLLEGDEPWMLLSQGGNVGLVAVIVEPPVHDGGLLAHLLLELVPGQQEVIDLASDHPRKRVRYLGHRHLVPRKVYLAPDPAVRALEGHGGEDADVVGVDHLEGLVRIERLREHTTEDRLPHIFPVLHEEDRTQYRVRYAAAAHVLLNLPLALEVWNSSPPVRASYRAVDVVVYTSPLRSVSELHTLPDLALNTDLPDLLDGEHPIDAIEHPLDGGAVFEVPACDLSPQLGELSHLGLLGSRVSARTPIPRSSSLRATAPPCWPVAPLTRIKRPSLRPSFILPPSL